MMGPPPMKSVQRHDAGMDFGNLSIGSDAGKFTGTQNLPLTRDTRFPIRVTLQRYRVTDADTITPSDIEDIAKQLKTTQSIATATGSLVTNRVTDRPTEPDLSKPRVSDLPMMDVDVEVMDFLPV